LRLAHLQVISDTTKPAVLGGQLASWRKPARAVSRNLSVRACPVEGYNGMSVFTQPFAVIDA
jgi:hypothetical protein